MKLNALNDAQKYDNKKITILNCPYEIQPAYLYHNYYGSEKVTWPWIKVHNNTWKIASKIKALGVSAFSNCPRLSLVHSTATQTQQHMTTFGSNMLSHDPLLKACYTILGN